MVQSRMSIGSRDLLKMKRRILDRPLDAVTAVLELPRRIVVGTSRPALAWGALTKFLPFIEEPGWFRGKLAFFETFWGEAVQFMTSRGKKSPSG